MIRKVALNVWIFFRAQVNAHFDRQTGRLAGRQTDRQADR
jgi:hypothetical protein